MKVRCVCVCVCGVLWFEKKVVECEALHFWGFIVLLLFQMEADKTFTDLLATLNRKRQLTANKLELIAAHDAEDREGMNT